MFYWTALIMIAVDQLSKLAVRLNLHVGESHTIWQGVLQFTYYQNSGAARSSFQGYGRLFGFVAVLFIIGVIHYRNKQVSNRGIADTGLAFLIAGAAGNGIERLLFGKVTYFLQFGSGDGILNVADLCINVGVLLVLIQQVVIWVRSGRQTEQ